jgi:hypothetical protein
MLHLANTAFHFSADPFFSTSGPVCWLLCSSGPILAEKMCICSSCIIMRFDLHLPGIGYGMNCSPYPFWASLAYRIQQMGESWVKPTSVSLAIGAITDLNRSRADLLVENALLRQQLIVLYRQIKRPQPTNGDRIRLVLRARCATFWNQATSYTPTRHTLALASRVVPLVLASSIEEQEEKTENFI